MKAARTFVCVGGGIVGIYSALRVRQLAPSARILLVEQDDALGGLLRSDPHPIGLKFDRGTHVLSQTGVAAIDSLLFDDLDPAHWHHFSGGSRDLCGLLYDNKVLEGSPFLPAPPALVEARLERGGPTPAGAGGRNLHATLLAHHGADITDRVFRTPIDNLYRCRLEEMHRFVAHLLPLSRVVTDDVPTWLGRAHDENYRALVAFPDQRTLPQAYASPLRAMYPRRMGVGQLFEKLGAQLAEAKVELKLRTKIARLDRTKDQITSISMSGPDGIEANAEEALQVVWASPPFQLLGLLGVPAPKAPFKPGWRTMIVDFCARLTRKLGCYYYIDYDRNDAFRLTNYSMLSEEAEGLEASPFTLELWWRDGDLDLAKAHTFVAERFGDLGLVEAREAITDVRIRQAAQGLPFATVANMDALATLTQTVGEAMPRNMTNTGLLCEPGLFFTGDLLRSAERRLSERFT